MFYEPKQSTEYNLTIIINNWILNSKISLQLILLKIYF